VPQAAAEEEPARGAELDDFARQAEAGEALDEAMPAAPEPEPRAAREQAKLGGAKPMPSKSSSKSASKSGPPPTPNAAPAEPSAKDMEEDKNAGTVDWTELADADSLRRKNRCTPAIKIYRRATDTADQALAARGYAGLGLCAERRGQDPAGHYARARKRDPNIDSFIQAEKARAYRGGGQVSKKRKAAPKADVAAENAFDEQN
jgi:hypothetical protein